MKSSENILALIPVSYVDSSLHVPFQLSELFRMIRMMRMLLQPFQMVRTRPRSSVTHQYRTSSASLWDTKSGTFVNSSCNAIHLSMISQEGQEFPRRILVDPAEKGTSSNGRGWEGARWDVPILASRRNRQPQAAAPALALGLAFVPAPAYPVEAPGDPASAPRQGTPDRGTPLSTRY
jgi:hypothetical protein